MLLHLAIPGTCALALLHDGGSIARILRASLPAEDMGGTPVPYWADVQAAVLLSPFKRQRLAHLHGGALDEILTVGRCACDA
jgi:hypothetical protein